MIRGSTPTPVAWVTGMTGAALIEKLGLPTERGRLKVQADLQCPVTPDAFSRPATRPRCQT